MDTAPIPFFSFGGYRRFCWRWWQDLARQLTTGLIADARTYWHRARYGWAPRDTWSLDWYLAGVFEQKLWRRGNLWWYPDGSMYVYYAPTHWSASLDGRET